MNARVLAQRVDRPARHRVAVLAVGAVAALLGWVIAGGNGPPLYDSVGVAGPYRYLCAPAGLNLSLHPPPDPASQTLPLSSGKSPAIRFTTDEQPIPQVQLLVQSDALVVPPGTTAITVSAAAVVPPQILPSDGVLDGNVYDIHITSGATAGGTPLTLSPGALATVVLLGPPTGKQATIEQFDGRTWTKLDTTPVGTADSFGANVTAFTTFALVLPGTAQTHDAAGCLPGTTVVTPGASGSASTSTSSASDTGGSSNSALILVGVAVVALAVAGGLLVVLRRTGQPPPARGTGGGGGKRGRDGGARRRRPPPRG